MNWQDVGPCAQNPEWLRAVNAILNVAQVIALAWLSNRAYRRDEREKRRYREHDTEP